MIFLAGIGLLGVIPSDYREVIDTAKAQTDFWANLCFLSTLLIVEYVGIGMLKGQIYALWIPLIAIGASWISYSRAKSAAIEWGDMVRASYDVFLPDLCKKIGFPLPNTRKEERELWTKFSQAITYRSPLSMPDKSPHALSI